MEPNGVTYIYLSSLASRFESRAGPVKPLAAEGRLRYSHNTTERSCSFRVETEPR